MFLLGLTFIVYFIVKYFLDLRSIFLNQELTEKKVLVPSIWKLYFDQEYISKQG